MREEGSQLGPQEAIREGRQPKPLTSSLWTCSRVLTRALMRAVWSSLLQACAPHMRLPEPCKDRLQYPWH